MEEGSFNVGFRRLGVGGEVWNWGRRLLAWEEEQVGECCELLTYIVL